MRKLRKRNGALILSTALALCAFGGLLVFPESAAEGARQGLSLCAYVIIPSLFPFAVLAGLLLELRLPDALGKLTAPLMKKLFRVSGQGSAAFFLGLAGGYPLGALTLSQMYSSGQLEKREAQRLLSFCDNCGPAFIIAMAGANIFHSSAVGFFLYGVHIAAAVLTGLILRPRKTSAVGAKSVEIKKTPDFSEGFSVSVKRATASAITVTGFVVFFSVLMALLDAVGILPQLCGRLSLALGTELHFTRSLLTGFLEIGTGIGSMRGLSVSPQNIALCAFILGWGGLSVQAQATAIIKESGLSAKSHLLGKLLHGVLSALLSFFGFMLLF